MEFLKDGKNAILEIKKSQEKFNLFTHADIENLSIYKEKEVLYFPFSVFGINNNFEIKQDEKGIYHVELIYLGKFLPNIEKDIKNKNLEEEGLPNTTFKIFLDKSGLIKNEKGNNMNIIQKQVLIIVQDALLDNHLIIVLQIVFYVHREIILMIFL